MSYKIRGIVDADEVPDWQRRPQKWGELVDKVLALEPGKTLEVEFDDPKAARRARNAVRDVANLQARAAIVRTRVVNDPDGESATLYLTRLHASSKEEEVEK